MPPLYILGARMYENPINLNIKYEHDPITEYPWPKEPSQLGNYERKIGKHKIHTEKMVSYHIKTNQIAYNFACLAQRLNK